MSGNNEITISVEAIEEVIKELKEISNLSSNAILKGKLERLQKFVSGFMELKIKVPVQDIVYDKMVEVKHTNPDLHLKLYMLYRNISSNRISEGDAMAAYESYLSMFPTDEMVF